MRRLTSLTLTAAALLASACGGGSSDDPVPVRPLTLALDFTPNAVHAGIYTAVAEDLDRRHGIALKIRAPSASSDSLKLLESGRADLAVVDIQDLGLARERGADLVGVGALVQRPLAAVIARAGVRRPRELEGLRVGVTGLPSDEAVLRAVVEADGGRYERVRRVTIGFSAVPSLVAGKVDAVTAFFNAEGVALRERGFGTREFRLEEAGAPAYPELVLATTRERLRELDGPLRATLAALREGTEAAVDDPSVPVREIARASDSRESLVRAQLEAIQPALRPPLRLDRAALEGWADFATRFGILSRRPDVARAFAFGLADG